jgi:hypothetical protein
MKLEVEIEDGVIPDKYEIIRIGVLAPLEMFIGHAGAGIVKASASASRNKDDVRIIVREKWYPSLSILCGLWVFPDNGNWYLCGCEPHQTSNSRWTSHSWQHRLPSDFIPPPDGKPRQIK